jgi:hypothetical protein
VASLDIAELLSESDYQPYVARPCPPGGWPNRDSLPTLRKSLDKAHDNLRHALRENDRLRAALLALHQRQRWQLRIFLTVMGITWTALGWALNLLIPYAIHGMAR